MCLAVGANAQQGSGITYFARAGLLYKNELDVAYPGLQTRDELPPCIRVLCQRLPAMGRVQICSMCRNLSGRITVPTSASAWPQTLRHEGRNHYGSLVSGLQAGLDTRKFLVRAAFRLRGNYVLRGGLDAMRMKSRETCDKERGPMCACGLPSVLNYL